MLRIVLLAALALVVAVSSHASSLAPSVLFTAVRDGVLTVRTFDAEGAPIGTVSAIAVASAASAALPPRRYIDSPAAEASGCEVETTFSANSGMRCDT